MSLRTREVAERAGVNVETLRFYERAVLESDNTVVYVAQYGKLIGAVALQDIKITQGLMAMEGVQKVLTDVKAKRVHVLHDPNRTNEERLRNGLKKLGYA